MAGIVCRRSGARSRDFLPYSQWLRWLASLGCDDDVVHAELEGPRSDGRRGKAGLFQCRFKHGRVEVAAVILALTVLQARVSIRYTRSGCSSLNPPGNRRMGYAVQDRRRDVIPAAFQGR